MKKIFGVLSLIAILTVSVAEAYAGGTAFTSQANANDIGSEVVYIGQSYDEAVVIRHFANAGIEIEFDSNGFIHLTDVSEEFASGEDVEIPDIASKDSVMNLGNDFAAVYLPFEVGLFSEASYNKSISLNLNQYVKNYNYTFGSEAPDIVSRISSNIGKLTKYNI